MCSINQFSFIYDINGTYLYKFKYNNAILMLKVG